MYIRVDPDELELLGQALSDAADVTRELGMLARTTVEGLEMPVPIRQLVAGAAEQAGDVLRVAAETFVDEMHDLRRRASCCASDAATASIAVDSWTLGAPVGAVSVPSADHPSAALAEAISAWQAGGGSVSGGGFTVIDGGPIPQFQGLGIDRGPTMTLDAGESFLGSIDDFLADRRQAGVAYIDDSHFLTFGIAPGQARSSVSNAQLLDLFMGVAPGARRTTGAGAPAYPAVPVHLDAAYARAFPQGVGQPLGLVPMTNSFTTP
jgi:hypothetical protein